MISEAHAVTFNSHVVISSGRGGGGGGGGGGFSNRSVKSQLNNKNVSENYPSARTQTTLYCMILLPVSVIKNTIRVGYCEDNNSV